MKFPAYVSRQLCHQQQADRELQTMLQNQALMIENFKSNWQMAGQEAHAYIARTRAQSDDFVGAEFNAVQRFEDSLQRQYDGQLRSHVNQWNPKYGWKGTVTTRFALIALVAWQYSFDSFLRKLFAHPKYG